MRNLYVRMCMETAGSASVIASNSQMMRWSVEKYNRSQYILRISWYCRLPHSIIEGVKVSNGLAAFCCLDSGFHFQTVHIALSVFPCKIK